MLILPNAYASYIGPHGYVVQSYGHTNYGGYFSSPYGQTDLYSNWSSTHTGSFITNEMWVGFNNSEWIETGDVDGSINGNYWAGHYVAYQKYSSGSYVYREYTVGSKYPTGTHNFEIQYVGSNTWNSYTDFSKTMSFSFPYGSSNDIDVGIETDDNQNYFLSGNYDNSLQYKNSGGTWYTWGSATNHDSNSLGWYSTFSSGKVNFYH